MKAILDLDTGIDDALALAYALAHPNLELIGVTCTYGNVTVPLAVRNTLALLELLDRPDIPVFAGPSPDGFQPSEISSFIHGQNGVGEVALTPSDKTEDTQPATDFLLQAVRDYGDDLVIIPTGPSTTIAQAMLADATFAANAHIVMMGGALTVPGNVSAWAEANISQDPDATDYLFRHSQDVTMVGLDVTLRTLLTEKETARWRETGTTAGEVFADMVDYYIRAYATTAPHLGGCGLHDPLAVAVAADPSLVEVIETNMKTDTQGPTRGRTIADETRLSQEPTAKVAVGADNERFVHEFVDYLEELFRTVGAK
ncbi:MULTISPECIES: nucleoside hydrolase [Corynebacterium]|uniref:nucleoside hydrolase n=1 Tax=Corynebacterium TaxID=1716 RepID=UPI00254E5A8F|nr:MULTISPECIES: nucleoside hydrolase [unclassified Corynebacterium]MDK8701444.1 nucleoside hydrolase [Corynebacterium sp. MSK107]MDK8703724.1 nucleoside hydrolase [Corynebacterium sp. MSK090]